MKRPPLQSCAAHGPYRAWRPVCPDCLREQNQVGRRQERTDNREPKRPVPYGKFPDGF